MTDMLYGVVHLFFLTFQSYFNYAFIAPKIGLKIRTNTQGKYVYINYQTRHFVNYKSEKLGPTYCSDGYIFLGKEDFSKS